MKETRCDGRGCSNAESSDLPDKQRTIRPVELKVASDNRDWVQAERFQADLCVDCVQSLQHTYFKVIVEGLVSVPGFLEATPIDHSRKSLAEER